MAHPAISLISVVIAAFIINHIEAKSGCEYFGHSCYGGIGKRTYMAEASEESMPVEAQDAEIPADVFKGPRSQLPYASREFTQTALSPKQYEQMNKYIREWVRNYLRKEHELERK
ncbi:uncharacterized protein LOC109539232 isoform X2 [Dendroctonus ponderosae]|uniref:Uncharacterized protein n=1 Tax=Dendroctonus ponderosae TaxID=77166 RepID=A0AAR5PNC4_DENPD|nr:uncharacterized protein LOC109539232 isoform X2 [Dendroctonus ponderosae]KAH1012462.1 hypothetical protein HUJ05_011619 [Dendroctonus ponderosae]